MEEAITIMYLHGYGSRFDPDSDKIRCLTRLGRCVGPHLDYGQGPDAVGKAARDMAFQEHPDLIVGTSMGGWLASHTGAALGIPFVALNPAIRPSQTLRKYIGKTVNYGGFNATIDAETVSAYYDFCISDGCGLILCEAGDEVLNADETIAYLEKYYATQLIPGGSHRFESLESQLDKIRHHYDIAGLIYGADELD